MQPVKVKLPSHTQNDTWEGLSIGPILFNDAQPDDILISCVMRFKRDSDNTVYVMRTSPSAGEGTITIDDAVTWEITVVSEVLPLDVGMWSWDFETTDNAGIIRTIYNGTLNITKEQQYGN